MPQPQIARFQIEAPLPDDWLGARLTGRDPQTGAQVLLRVLSPHLLREPAFLAAVRSAPERLAGLRHPHIAPVLESGEVEGRCYLVMPFVPGETLAARLAADPGLWRAEAALAVLTQVASALDAARAQGIYHGNLAPPHILIGPDGFVTVTDFGLAWAGELGSGPLVSAAGPDLALTMAPEVLAGAEATGAGPDLYAMAALAYRLLAGEWPFPGRTAAEVARAALAGSPADPRLLNGEIGEELAAVLLAALAKDPAQRYLTGAALVAALATASAGRPWQRIGLAFVPVPAGPFTFGEGASVRVIELPRFEMGVYPVTVAQFAAFVEATGYVTQAEREGWGLAFDGSAWQEVQGACWRAPRGPGSSSEGRERHPVVQVSCHDAAAFCDWAGVALPDEQQWEKAARGGLPSPSRGESRTREASHGARVRIYPWGDHWRPELCHHAGSGLRDTVSVDQHTGDASPYGVHGLAGNVWEWTTSAYDAAGEYRVLRGGAWPHDGRYLRATFRYYALPGYRSDALGFRCIRPEQERT